MVTLKNRIIIALAICLGLLNAQPGDLNHIYENIISTYDSVETFQADFVQENYWPEMEVSQTSDGIIYYDSEFLLMEYSTPEGQIMLIDPANVTIYDAASQQALISPKQAVKLRPIEVIKHYWELSEISILDETEEGIELKLKVNNGEIVIIKIVNSLVSQISIMDTDKNTVTYKFNLMRINEEIPAETFEFKIPEDARIIDNRKIN